VNSCDLRALAENLERAAKVLRETATAQDKAHQLLGIATDHISDLHLSIRTRNLLLSEGIESISQLLSRSADDLSQSRGIGEIAIREIRTQLASRGLCLSGELLGANNSRSVSATIPLA